MKNIDLLSVTIYYILSHSLCHAKIMRNSALMSKMVSNYQKDPLQTPTELPDTRRETTKHVIHLMQNVLCKNFPDVPCKMIMNDNKLKRLIHLSIKEINNKMSLTTKPTPTQKILTLFPTITSEDLSNFLEVKQTGYFQKNPTHDHKSKKKKRITNKIINSGKTKERNRRNKNSKKTTKRKLYSGTRKLSKFFPHKVKIKDQKPQKEISVEKLSMSVETPSDTFFPTNDQYQFKLEPDEPPVWRIDYTKHGEPSLNHGYELRGKLFKNVPNLMVDDNALEGFPRKGVKRPDIVNYKGIGGISNELSSDDE